LSLHIILKYPDFLHDAPQAIKGNGTRKEQVKGATGEQDPVAFRPDPLSSPKRETDLTGTFIDPPGKDGT
jgi:hypothetical protein